MIGFSLLFFDISTGEIFIILLLVFIVFGPSKLPELAKKIGRAVYEVKRASNEIKREIDTEVRRIEKEDIKGDIKTGIKNEKPNPITETRQKAAEAAEAAEASKTEADN